MNDSAANARYASGAANLSGVAPEPERERLIEANRSYWNERVPEHARSEHYGLESFRAGKLSLYPLEIDELGPVTGKRLLHLGCHFGLDTLSWARLGARVTGVDLSDAAIDTARRLAAECGIDARFIRSNILELDGTFDETLDQQFDIVFMSYGVIDYLPDLSVWARIIADRLARGGVFYLAEIHPFALAFDHGPSVKALELKHPYSFKAGVPGCNYGQRLTPIAWDAEGEPTFTGGDARFSANKVYSWNHGIGEVVTSLITAGLRLEFLHEYPYGCYEIFPFLQRRSGAADDGWWRLPEHAESLPLLYTLRAVKP